MKSFFKSFFASTLGVIVGVTIMFFFGLMMVFASALSSGNSQYVVAKNSVLKLELDGNISDKAASSPLGMLMGGPSKGMLLDDIIGAIKKAKENDRIKGIYIKGGMLHAGISDLEPIRRALIDFKASGKFIFSYADSYTQGTYYLASVADKIALNPLGSVSWSGLGMSTKFERGYYEKLGVRYDIFKVGTFKSAVEPFIQDKMSDANRLQTSSFMNSIWSHWLENVSASRNISVDQLNAYADECLDFSPADSVVQYKMIDTLMYSTGISDYLKNKLQLEGKNKVKLATVSNMKSVKWNKKGDEDNRIAVLYAEGAITGDDNPIPFGLGGSTITAKTYVEELKRLEKDDDVKAVVFRVNSPGGSAYASEQIWNAVVELKAKKPVIVSMGSYAASGGYYISCAADTIVAEPTTITGSIGIFAAIPNGTELAKKLGFSYDEVKTNTHSTFGGQVVSIPFLAWGLTSDFTDKERNMLQKNVERGYDLFLTRCASGRGKTNQEIDSVGQGRVWTGKQAIELGLVDVLGGLDDAIKIAAKKANIDDYVLNTYPAEKDFMAKFFEESMGGMQMKTAKFFMGEETYNNRLMMNQILNTDINMAVMSERIIY